MQSERITMENIYKITLLIFSATSALALLPLACTDGDEKEQGGASCQDVVDKLNECDLGEPTSVEAYQSTCDAVGQGCLDCVVAQTCDAIGQDGPCAAQCEVNCCDASDPCGLINNGMCDWREGGGSCERNSLGDDADCEGATCEPGDIPQQVDPSCDPDVEACDLECVNAGGEGEGEGE